MEKEERKSLGQWSQNVIVADADYVDDVAFNLIVNFERMLGRRIPPADMARWAECIALDGGLRADGNGGAADAGGAHPRQEDFVTEGLVACA